MAMLPVGTAETQFGNFSKDSCRSSSDSCGLTGSVFLTATFASQRLRYNMGQVSDRKSEPSLNSFLGERLRSCDKAKRFMRYAGEGGDQINMLNEMSFTGLAPFAIPTIFPDWSCGCGLSCSAGDSMTIPFK